jgi:hypothetical protein
MYSSLKPINLVADQHLRNQDCQNRTADLENEKFKQALTKGYVADFSAKQDDDCQFYSLATYTPMTLFLNRQELCTPRAGY